MKLLLLFLLLGSGHGKKPVEQAERVEINTCYDKGKECFTQVLFWRWSPDYMRYDIASWTLIDRATITPRAQGWLITIRGEGEVVATHVFRTHTSVEHDPERLNKRRTGDNFRIPIFPRSYTTP